MFRLIEPSSGQNRSTGTFSECLHTHWMYEYYGFALMMAQWAETCRRIFNFLILITNIFCVTNEINLLYYRRTQWDGSYRNRSQRFQRFTSMSQLDLIHTRIYGNLSHFSLNACYKKKMQKPSLRAIACDGVFGLHPTTMKPTRPQCTSV